MEYPVLFPLHSPIENLPVERVRELALRHGFSLVPNRPANRSEIWLRGSPFGYASLRLDEQGHGNGPAARGHRHKEWVPREYLELYMRAPAVNLDERQTLARVVVLYDDQGVRIINTHHFDSPNARVQGDAARQSHIPR